MTFPKQAVVRSAVVSLAGAAALFLSACGESVGSAGDGQGQIQSQGDASAQKETQMASTPPVIPSAGRPLATELQARREAFGQRASDDIKTLYDAGIQAVVDAGVVENARSMGDEAPGFELTNQSGEVVSLASLLEQGPVVLLWYRGGWCPYCNLTLRAYQERLDDIGARGATLVALSPELPDRSISTAEKEGLGFQVLSDVGNAVAREYGVVFSLTEGVQENYEKAFGLSAFNGDDSGELPLAATYVIDRSGIIRWAFLDADYRNRAEPADVIAALDRLPPASSGASGG
jgi:peroxiredoxin